MARLATTITTTFAPTTAELLRQFAQYVDEIDGIEATPAELAESLFDQERHEGLRLDDSLIAAELAEHGRFQAWRTNRKAVLRAYGWEAYAARNCRKSVEARAV